MKWVEIIIYIHVYTNEYFDYRLTIIKHPVYFIIVHI